MREVWSGITALGTVVIIMLVCGPFMLAEAPTNHSDGGVSATRRKPGTVTPKKKRAPKKKRLKKKRLSGPRKPSPVEVPTGLFGGPVPVPAVSSRAVELGKLNKKKPTKPKSNVSKNKPFKRAKTLSKRVQKSSKRKSKKVRRSASVTRQRNRPKGVSTRSKTASSTKTSARKLNPPRSLRLAHARPSVKLASSPLVPTSGDGFDLHLWNQKETIFSGPPVCRVTHKSTKKQTKRQTKRQKSKTLPRISGSARKVTEKIRGSKRVEAKRSAAPWNKQPRRLSSSKSASHVKKVNHESWSLDESHPARSVNRPVKPTRRRIIVGMPTARVNSSGELVVEPNIEVTTARVSNIDLVPREEIVQTAANRAGESVEAPPGKSLRFPQTPRMLFDSSHQITEPAAIEILLPSPGAPILSPALPTLPDLDASNETIEASDEILRNIQLDETSASVLENFEAMPEPVTEPLFGRLVEETINEACSECAPWRRLFGFHFHKTSDDIGIGHERVVFAPFEIDATQPSNNFRIRFDSSYGLETPDRAEYFWAKPGRGPQTIEQGVDYQDIRFQMELGSKRFSAITEIPIRILDPEVNGNTAGLGDIVVGNKTVLIDGKLWQITQVFRTYMNSGSPTKGLGRGHVAMEPGLLARFEWSDRTYLHGEMKYLFAVAGDPDHTGEVLRYGFGVSHLLYETDTFAVIPTLEFIGWTVLDGLKTLPNGVLTAVDGEQFGTIHPGVRFVLGPSGDLGLFELGIGGAVTTSSNGWYENQLRIDLKWSF